MNSEKRSIITIDGPSGAGKSTIAKLLAKRIGYTHIDSGAIYRGIAYAYSIRQNNETVDSLLSDLVLSFEFGENTRVRLGEQDITDEIRHPEISLLASSLSKLPEVRNHANAMQRSLGQKGRVILEGRDTGSVVYPEADIKFYLDARPDERANRRYSELVSKGVQAMPEAVRKEMEERDRNDTERAIAPLVVPDGAIYIDTTGLGVRGVLAAILRHIEGKDGI